MSSLSRDLIIHIQRKHLLTAYNVQIQQCKYMSLQNLETPAQFFASFQSIFNLNRIKAIVFCLNGRELPTLKQQYEFLCECRRLGQENGIFCFFPSGTHQYPAAAISLTKTVVKEGEKVVMFYLGKPGLCPLGFTLIRKKDYYEIVEYHNESKYQPFTQRWEENIFGSVKPKKIFFAHGNGSNDLEKAQRFFKSYDLVVVKETDFLVHYTAALADKILFLMDGKVNQYDVANPCWCIFDVQYDGESLMLATIENAVPFEKSVVIKVNPRKHVSLFCDCVERSRELFEEIKLSTFKCKKVTVTLKLDYNSFYEFKVEPVDKATEIEYMLKEHFDVKYSDKNKPCETDAAQKPHVPEKARLVFDKQNFCISCFADEKEYGLNDFNGSDKIPIYISFTETKPLVGKAAMEMYNEKPSFVVFDLIKLCSVTIADVENPKWGFSLSKEEESVIVTMETVDGEKKSTVEFLLALILKNGNDRIKKKYGKRMKEIEIGFDGFVPNEMLKKNFIEAGKLLKINIVFV